MPSRSQRYPHSHKSPPSTQPLTRHTPSPPCHTPNQQAGQLERRRIAVNAVVRTGVPREPAEVVTGHSPETAPLVVAIAAGAKARGGRRIRCRHPHTARQRVQREILETRLKHRAPDYGTRLMSRLKLDRLSTPATLPDSVAGRTLAKASGLDVLTPPRCPRVPAPTHTKISHFRPTPAW